MKSRQNHCIVRLKLRSVVCLLIWVVAAFCQAQQTQQSISQLITDFDSLVAGVQDTIASTAASFKTELKKVTDDVSFLPSENQKKFIDEIAGSQTTIDTQIDAAGNAIQQISSQTKDRLQIIQNQFSAGKMSAQIATQNARLAIASANNQLGQLQLKLKASIGTQLNAVKTGVEQAVAPYRQQAVQQKIIAAQKAEQAHREKMRKLVVGLSNAFPQLKSARIAAQQMTNEFQTQGVIAGATLAAVSRSYRFALQALSTAYAAVGISIDFNDKSNLVSSTQKELIRVFLDDISRSVNKATGLLKQQKQDDYFRILYQLTQRLSGVGKAGGALVVASGYEAAVRSFAKEFFQTQQEAVVNFFLLPKKQMTLEMYQQALQQMVAIESPTDKHVRMAAAFLYQIGTHFPLIDPNAVAAIKKSANSNYALIVAARARTLLKEYQPGKDNQPLLLQVVNAYGQAATYFGQAEDQANALQYQKMHDALKSALQLAQQATVAEQLQNYDQAINLYSQAFAQFNQAGAIQSAQESNKKMLNLQAEQSKLKGVRLLSAFAQQSRATLQAYLAYISEQPIDATQSGNFETIVLGLAKNAQQAIDYFNDAVQKYQALGVSTVDLQAAIAVLAVLIKLQGVLFDTDQLIRAGALDALATAQNNYFPRLIEYAQSIDSQFAAQKGLRVLVPVAIDQFANDQLNQLLARGQQWNFSLLVKRHLAKLLTDTAAQLTDSLAVCQFTAAAQAIGQMQLFENLENKIKNTLDQCSQQKDQLALLSKQAVQKENDALRMAAQSWTPIDPNAAIYASEADNAWKDALRLYMTAYHLGDAQAEESYVRALTEYLAAYKQNAPDPFPYIGAATIAYHLYVLDKEKNDQSSAQVLIKTIEDSLSSFFQAIKLLSVKINQPDLRESAPANQAILVKMLARFDQLMADQQAIASQLAPSRPFKEVQLFDKKIDTVNGTVTILMGLADQQPLLSFQSLLPDDGFARLYQSLAEQYVAQKNYLEAAKAFKQAIHYFNTIGQVDLATKLNDEYQLAYTRSLIDAYVNLIIPNQKENRSIGTATLAGISVPERYLLYSYVQEIPSYIPFVITPDQIKSLSPAQLTDQLVTYAFLLYMDHVLKDNGIQFGAVFEGVTLRSTFNVTPDQLSLVQNLLNQGAGYVQDLKQRIAKQESSLRVAQRVTATGQSVLELYELYKPIPNMALPGISMTALPYSSFPTVQFYYGWARKLADPSVKIIPTAGYTYVSGNDPEGFARITQLMAQAHISAALAYRKRVDYLMNGGQLESIDPLMSADEKTLLQKARQDIVVLKKIDKNDMSVQLASYMDTYKLMQTYIQSVVMIYCSLAASLYEQIQDKQKADALNVVINGDLYQLLGDCAQLFLVGDPRDPNYFWGSQGTYGGILIDIKNYYLTAATAYGPKTALYNSLINRSASLFINAGDILVNQKNYFAAITFYSFAVGALKSLQPIDQKKLDAASLKWLAAYYRGASANMMKYREARSQPLQLTLSNGQQVSEQLVDLIARADTADPVEQQKMQEMKEILLDALIYYMGGSLAAQQGANSAQATARSSSATAQTQVPSDQAGAAAQKIVAQYMAQQGISFASLDEILKWFMSAIFEQTLFGAFDFFSQQIVNATDDATRKTGYRALGSWMNSLCYDAFGKIYMQDYLGGISPDTLQLFLKNIGDEAQNIIAPASQWVG